MAGRKVSTSSQELWLMAKTWLASTNVLPPGHKVYDPSPTVFDLAHSLRDGVALCQVANCLRPYSVRDINLKPQLSPFLCLKNIRAFLHACVNNLGLKESVLFDAHELYDVSDFGKVVMTLSHLSKCKHAISAGLIPFPSDRAATLSTYYKDEDIYGNLEEIALTKDVAEENVYDAVTIEDDTKIYDDVISLKKRLKSYKDPHASREDEKRSYVIDELLGTEQNYVEALTTIKEKFIDQLQNILSADDRKKIFVNILDLLGMHKLFLGKLERACRTKKDVGSAISNCFIIDKDKFLEYGKYCREMQAAQNHVDKLSESDADINRHLIECCQNANGGKFSLRSLLVVPMQRVLKYPLLLRELIKHSKNHNTDKTNLEKALAAMQDVAHYINAVKRDDESTSAVNQIQASLIRDKEAPPNLIKFGLLVKDGDIQIKINEDRNLKKRYAFLFDRVLLMCKVRGEQYDHKETLYLDHYNVNESVTSSGKGKFIHGWTMNGNSPEAGRAAYEMFTKTDDMKRKWVEDIQRTMRVFFLNEGFYSSLITDNGAPRSSATYENQALSLQLAHLFLPAAKSNLTLADYNLGNHRLELSTFPQPTYCSVCKNLLWGLINQGYSCKACNHVCHKECIEKSPVCKVSKSGGNSSRRSVVKQTSEPIPPNSPPLPPRGRNKSEPVAMSWTPTAVIALARFHGWAPGKKNTLVFEAGEEIDVLQTSDPEWWEGKSRKTGKQGFFPRNHVEILDGQSRKGALQDSEVFFIRNQKRHTLSLSSISETADSLAPSTHNSPLNLVSSHRDKDDRDATRYEKSSDLPPTTIEEAGVVDGDLTKFKWYVGKMGRDEAKDLLEKLSDGTFLVRESSTVPGQYALSLKHKYNVKHIKIVVSTGMYCLTALKLFPSIASMIDYYRNNTLGVSFPGLDTCLTRGVNEKRRESNLQIIGYARGRFDYEARDPREISIKKNSRILVINKDGDWWKGENEDGQVGFFPSNFVQPTNGDFHVS